MSWKNESRRHSMASRGIKSSDNPIRELQNKMFREKRGLPPGFVAIQKGGIVEITNLNTGLSYDCSLYAYKSVMDALWNLTYKQDDLTTTQIKNTWHEMPTKQKKELIDNIMYNINEYFKKSDLSEDTSYDFAEEIGFVTPEQYSYDELEDIWPAFSNNLKEIIQKQHDML